MLRWTPAHDDTGFMPTVLERTVKKLPPGAYEPMQTPAGVFFARVNLRDDDLLKFSGSVVQQVNADVEDFWGREDAFAAHGLPFKRGVLLHGPPGSGKTSAVSLIVRDCISSGGVVLTYVAPKSFSMAYRALRAVEGKTRLVVVMEDLDTVMAGTGASDTLNILDGAEDLSHVLFVATTNFPEQLGPRVMNRPSRFDRIYHVPFPDEAQREQYVMSLIKDGDVFDVRRAVQDTNGLSLAHIKELVVGTVVLGAPYEQVVKSLKSLSDPASSLDGLDFPRGRYA